MWGWIAALTGGVIGLGIWVAATRTPVKAPRPDRQPTSPVLMVVGAIGLLALGGGLIWLGLWLFGDFEPHCVSNSQWECFDTVEEQRTAYNRDTFAFVFLPGALIIVGGLRMLYLARRRSGS
jgi:uncharacterized iron-regulated membrane protein